MSTATMKGIGKKRSGAHRRQPKLSRFGKLRLEREMKRETLRQIRTMCLIKLESLEANNWPDSRTIDLHDWAFPSASAYTAYGVRAVRIETPVITLDLAENGYLYETVGPKHFRARLSYMSYSDLRVVLAAVTAW